VIDLNPYAVYFKIAGAALLALAIGAASWWVTATYFRLQISGMEKQQALAITIAQDRAAHQQEDADKITHDADVANAEAHQKIVYRTQTIIQKVPEYVTPETDARFPLPCGFLRLHDAAASSVDPSAVSLPAGKSDFDKCDVTTSVAASAIAGNYGLALGWRADLNAWSNWYTNQKTNWDAYRASVMKEK
jgi:hypothetical protein